MTDAERNLIAVTANVLLVLLSRTGHHDLVQALMTARQEINIPSTSSEIGHG
jgi:hypothetical protein